VYRLMRKIWFYVTLMVVFGMFLPLVRAAELPSVSRVLDYALCRGLDQDGLPLERIEQFSTEDGKIICWVFLEEVLEGETLRWEFISPEGAVFESILIIEETKKYVGAQGILDLLSNASKIVPGEWKVRFYTNDHLVFENSFVLIESNVLGSKDIDEAIQRTLALLEEFGYKVLNIGLSEDNQAFVQMQMVSKDLSQAVWNQIGFGFESLRRLFPGASWFLVQLVLDGEYALSFQVRALDFLLWREGKLSKDEFWKKKVIRYVYNIREKKEIEDVSRFYFEKFGVVY